MKKSLYTISFLILLIVSFVGGFRFNQSTNNGESAHSGDRIILHYVDPMNPGNTSKEPGIAPCGMPMEPVYADDGDGSAAGLPPGVVKLNETKMQLIGVQTAEVTSTSESAYLRVLGKIKPDENKVYSIVSGTDGWMGEIHDSTTGSVVRKDQLMGKIRMYDYDFYTWQQRYLTELGNAGRRRVYISPLSGMAKEVERATRARIKAGALLPDPGAPMTLPSKDRQQSPSDMINHSKTDPHTDNSNDNSQPEKMQGNPDSPAPPSASGIPPGTLYYGQGSQPEGDPDDIIAKMMHEKNKIPELPDGPAPELPDTAVAELPHDTDVSDISPDSHMRDSAPDAAIEQKSSQMAHSHNKADGQTMPMPMQNNPAKMEKSNGMTAAHDHASMSAAANPPAKGDGHEEMMTHPSPSPGLMSPGSKGKNPPHQKSGRHYFSGEDDILYASKARQELLDLGVSDSQLKELADTGVYVTSVQLYSPVDGLILSRNVTPHQKIDRGQECFRIADVSTVWVEADVFDIEERLLPPGTLAKVSLPNTSEYRMAKVTEVLPYFTVDSRTLKVRLEVENEDYRFRPDMFVDVEFLLKLESAITVPSAAVIDSGKHAIVYVVSDEGVFEPRFVTTGWRFNERIQITSGLSPDEQIVVSGNFLIDSESRMKLAAARLMDEEMQPAAASVNQHNSGRTLPKVMPNMSSGQQAIDPICGMTVDPANAHEDDLTAEFQGQTYYFCSEECLKDFHRHGPKIENSMPQPSSTTGAMEMEEPHHDHMDGDNKAMDMSMDEASSEHQGPVNDPVCNMDVDIDHALSADLTSDYEGKTYYFCSSFCKDRFEQSPLDFLDEQVHDDSLGHEGHNHD